jgi:AIPR protein
LSARGFEHGNRAAGGGIKEKEVAMATRKFAFNSHFARRIPDPIFHKSHGIERHILMVPVRAVPPGLPLDPNARLPSNTRRRVYREVENSLLNGGDNVPGTFHLKHKGVTIIADSVQKRGENEYIVTMQPGHGIVDGGHTYKLISDNLSNPELPTNQFVKFEIITNVPEDWITDIAGGLNTSVQVEDMSLDNLANKFEWIKDELAKQPYFKRLAWREGDEGEYDARDVIGLMTCFLIDEFPNNGTEHPVMAYEKKSKALELFENEEENYQKVRPILKDILTLHDTISLEARQRWNDAMGGKAGHATFMEKRERGKFKFIFIGKEDERRLSNAALYPMLAAFRWMVEEDQKTKNYRWRGGFKAVLERWEQAAPDLMALTFDQNRDAGRTPNALGKSRAHWNNLHTKLRAIDQDAQLKELRKRAKSAA